MRITNRIVTEKYLRSVNNISTELDRLNSQVVTGKKFTKVSEDTPAAVKAFQIRKDLARVEGYQSSIRHAQSTLNNAESTIMKAQELLHDAREKIVQGLNGTQSIEERQIISTHLKELQKQMLQLLNANAADIYYFGGNSVRQEPFSVAEDGSLQYRCKDGDSFRWVKLKDLVTEDDPATPNTDEAALYKELMNSGLFVDIGMGIRSENAPPSPSSAPYVDRNSVFTYTLPGLEITGAGTVTTKDGEKVSANIYDLLGEISKEFASTEYSYNKTDELFGFLYGYEKDQLPRAIRVSSPNLQNGDPNPEYDGNSKYYDPALDTNPPGTGDKPTGAAAFDQAKYDSVLALYKDISGEHRPGSAQTVQFAITNIGTKMQFLNFMTASMTDRELDGLTQQQNTEFVDPAKAIIYHESQKVAYQAALNMGAQVIPMSIFTYMR
jgi:flagellar hook-associated protein 3 FlgL